MVFVTPPTQCACASHAYTDTHARIGVTGAFDDYQKGVHPVDTLGSMPWT